ncbi:hypothetical protein [Nannocystis sp.]|uniref:hypothetical protein n=1 Tax=Nannocystis sp. TaxID=1962667 RepID=UPI0025CB9309|nr:hypothetical protein [Nannocystis sp.]MBK7830512.1 hypothetical protein [Nannocystis sp.]
MCFRLACSAWTSWRVTVWKSRSPSAGEDAAGDEAAVAGGAVGLEVDVDELADEALGQLANCRSPWFRLFHRLDSAPGCRRGGARDRLVGCLAARRTAEHEQRTLARLVDTERRAELPDLLAPVLAADLVSDEKHLLA